MKANEAVLAAYESTFGERWKKKKKNVYQVGPSLDIFANPPSSPAALGPNPFKETFLELLKKALGHAMLHLVLLKIKK